MLEIIIIVIDSSRNFRFFLSLWIPEMSSQLYSFFFLPMFKRTQKRNHQLEHENKAILHLSSFQKEILKCWELYAAWYTMKSFTVHWDYETWWCVAFSEYNFPGRTVAVWPSVWALWVRYILEFYLSLPLFLNMGIFISRNQCFKEFFSQRAQIKRTIDLESEDLVSISGSATNKFCDFGRLIYFFFCP